LVDTNVGFIGLGNVGSKIANNILKDGFNLYIYDLNEELSVDLVNDGATWCHSISDLIEKTSIFITCLPSPESVNNVLTQAIPNLNNEHLWIEMSTTDESEILRLANLCLEKGAETLEAPVSGGQHRAETGNISILSAGKRINFDRALPILSLIGYQILYCGKLGNASVLKVATNYLASINLITLGEAMMVCKKYGLDLKTIFHGIRISSGNSFVHETESQVILNGSYDVGFTMDLVCKDLKLFDKLTRDYNISTQISPLILNIFEEGKKLYGKRALSTSIVKLLEDKCQEYLRAPGFPSKLVDKEIKKKGIEIKF
jgi:3-hydroxyisobutyrate dehydrogenase